MPVKTVVVVGGNFGGLAAVHTMAGKAGFRVILIDQREYFEYTPGVLRLFCDPQLFRTMASPTPQGTHEFVLGTVTSVSLDHVIVSQISGCTRRIDLDYLILATGADYRQPITPPPSDISLSLRAASWHREAARVRTAESVLILGGGAVGTELAAEIVCHFPRKRVTIVDAQPSLVPLFPRQTTQHVERWFRNRGVELFLGQPLEKWDDCSCTTKDGQVIQADVVFVCFGMRCNSQCISGGDMHGCLGPRKEVRVDDYLRIEGRPCAFAVGDVMAHPSGEIKQAYYAEMNGAVAAQNVLRHARGKPLLRYPEDFAGASVMPLVYVVSLGRYDGSLGFNRLVINGPFAALMKWFIEWTKMRQMEGRPIGLLIWTIADAITIFLSRTCLKPAAKGSD